jgi:1-acyl-sn-glycerol-3-phosphate acyltransferase
MDRIFADMALAPPQRLWVWRLLFPPVRWIVMHITRIEMLGRDHVPASGAFIVVANHVNWKDPPVVSVALGIPIRWMAKSEVFGWPIIGFLLRGVGNFGIRRGESDRRAMQLAMKVLERGLPLGVFPEGHRSERRALLRGRPGISLLAEKTDALIVPCGIAGTPTPFVGLIGRKRIRLAFGTPFRISDLPAEIRHDRQAATDAIMLRIAALLPAEMRGVYSEGTPKEPLATA